MWASKTSGLKKVGEQLFEFSRCVIVHWPCDTSRNAPKATQRPGRRVYKPEPY